MIARCGHLRPHQPAWLNGSPVPARDQAPFRVRKRRFPCPTGTALPENCALVAVSLAEAAARTLADAKGFDARPSAKGQCFHKARLRPVLAGQNPPPI